MKATDLKIGNIYKFSNKSTTNLVWLADQHCIYVEPYIGKRNGQEAHRFYFLETKEYLGLYPHYIEHVISEV